MAQANTQAQPTNAELMALVAKLNAENEALKAKAAAKNVITFKIAPPQEIKDANGKGTGQMKPSSGALCCYGLGRFPITLYARQWLRLMEKSAEVKAFITANRDALTWKDGDTGE